jgi:hypothetical protein
VFLSLVLCPISSTVFISFLLEKGVPYYSLGQCGEFVDHSGGHAFFLWAQTSCSLTVI